MKTLYIPDNWNGQLLADCFPFIRPASDELMVGDDIEVSVKKTFAGYGKIISGSPVKWQHINENMAFMLIGKNSPYLKTVLKNVFHFSTSITPHPDFPCFFGIAQWTQRHIPTHDQLFKSWYERAKEKHTVFFSEQIDKEQTLLFQD